MDPQEYQSLAERTECDQDHAMRRVATQYKLVRMNHAAIGLAGDAGEVCAAIERCIYYGQPLNEMNVVEELGDCLWYIAQMCNALGVDLGKVMSANIEKLKRRYPEKFDGDMSLEKNRRREQEMHAIQQEMELRECKTCGTDERCTEGDGLPKTLKDVTTGHLCPRCKTAISDEVVKQLYLGKRAVGRCPECRCKFVLHVSARTDTDWRLMEVVPDA